MEPAFFYQFFQFFESLPVMLLPQQMAAKPIALSTCEK